MILFFAIYVLERYMTVYLTIFDENDDEIAGTLDFSAREYGVFHRGLSSLLGSKNDPHPESTSGWNISRVEDDPTGFLILAMCRNTNAVIRVHEAKSILVTIKHINFMHLSDAWIAEILEKAFDETLLAEGYQFDGEQTVSWFKRQSENLISLLEILACHEGTQTRICIY
jgi:hypothetical protein